MSASLGELFIELGVFADTKELKEFEQKLGKVKDKMEEAGKKATKTNAKIKSFAKGLVGVATAIGGAILAISKLTDSLVASNQEFLNLTRTSDIALGTFQKWNAVGRMFGVRNAAQQLENLNQRLFELQLTGEGAKGFMIADINPMGQDAEGVMEQLRSRVAGLDDTSAAYLLRQMGLDSSMLHLLRMSREEFEELGKTIKKYQLTDEQRKNIQAMNVQLEIAKIKLQYLKDRAILAIMPYFIKLMQSLARVAEMFAKFGKNVGTFLVKWRGLVLVFVTALRKFAPVTEFFKNFSKAIGKLIKKLPIFGRLLGMVGGIFAKWILPLTLLYLLLDDLAVYLQGGDSLIGRVTDWMKDAGGDFSNIFGKMFGGDFWGGLSDLLRKLVDILDDFGYVVAGLVQAIIGIPIKDWIDKERKDNWAYEDFKNYDYGARTPQMNKNVSTNKVSYDNRSVTMNNTISTTQTGETLISDLYYAQNYAFNYA